MHCSYHTSARARIQCSVCARALCPSCDHRIKGYPYCEDCIVTGVESISRGRGDKGRGKGQARLAALLALLPGMGAVYNRQNLKAVVHFIAVVGLFQFASLRIVPAAFSLAGIIVYLYSIIDSYRTAQLIAQGTSAAANEEEFKRSLIKHAPAIGLMLMVIGAVIVARTIWNVSFMAMARVFPVFLIILGGYLLTRYFKRSSGARPADDYARHPGYPTLTERFEEKTAGNVRRLTRPGGR